MPKPVIVITGANGFLGSQLVKHFAGKGWIVRALVRDPKKYTNSAQLAYMAYDMNEPVNKTIFEGADYLVHAAYVKQSRQCPDAMQINITAAKRLLAASRSHRLKKNIFISSMSAHKDAVSVYGKQKQAIEKLFNQTNDICLRPGLIVGAGGIVQTMVDFMKSKHMVPLIAGGKQPVQLISLQDVVKAVDHALGRPVHGTFTVAHPQVITYKEFYQLVSQRLHIAVVFVPAPYYLLLGGLTIASKLPLNLGIEPDNLRGLKKLQAVDTHKDLEQLAIKPQALDKYLDIALARHS
jgi:nucleoside-diphosphate-sugar epimerase